MYFYVDDKNLELFSHGVWYLYSDKIVPVAVFLLVFCKLC